MYKYQTRYALLVCLASLLLTTGCKTQPPRPDIQPIARGQEIGIVLMHGKNGTVRTVESLANILRKAGVRVLTPEMPWHNRRIYDKDFLSSLQEIQTHVAQLKAEGARHVYVAGHSLGAVATAGYGARFDDVNGLILLAPGHFTSEASFRRIFVDDLKDAERRIQAGDGNLRTAFTDVNSGTRSVRMSTPVVFQSWFAPDGPADFQTNMGRIKPGLSVLYVAGQYDYIQETQNRAYAFDRMSHVSSKQFIVIDSGHMDLPEKAAYDVIEWLRMRTREAPRQP